MTYIIPSRIAFSEIEYSFICFFGNELHRSNEAVWENYIINYTVQRLGGITVVLLVNYTIWNVFV